MPCLLLSIHAQMAPSVFPFFVLYQVKVADFNLSRTLADSNFMSTLCIQNPRWVDMTSFAEHRTVPVLEGGRCWWMPHAMLTDVHPEPAVRADLMKRRLGYLVRIGCLLHFVAHAAATTMRSPLHLFTPAGKRAQTVPLLQVAGAGSAGWRGGWPAR